MILAVNMTRVFCHGANDGLKYIGIVIGFFTLQGHAQPFKSHTCIHMLLRKIFQLATFFAIELDEYQVPDFNHQRVVLIYQLCTAHLFTVDLIAQVDVDLGTGSARTDFAHLPEIVFFRSIKDALWRKELCPDISCFLVPLKPILLITFIYGDINTLGIKLHPAS